MYLLERCILIKRMVLIPFSIPWEIQVINMVTSSGKTKRPRMIIIFVICFVTSTSIQFFLLVDTLFLHLLLYMIIIKSNPATIITTIRWCYLSIVTDAALLIQLLPPIIKITITASTIQPFFLLSCQSSPGETKTYVEYNLTFLWHRVNHYIPFTCTVDIKTLQKSI